MKNESSRYTVTWFSIWGVPQIWEDVSPEEAVFLENEGINNQYKVYVEDYID